MSGNGTIPWFPRPDHKLEPDRSNSKKNEDNKRSRIKANNAGVVKYDRKEGGHYSDDLYSFFDKCYNKEENTINLPVDWVHHYKRLGGNPFIDQFNSWIDDRKVPLVGCGYNKDMAVADFDKLSDLDGKSLLIQKPWIHNFEYKYAPRQPPTVIRGVRIGNVCSQAFNSEYRSKTPTTKNQSAIDMWNNSRRRRAILGMLHADAKHPSVVSSRALLHYMMNCGVSFFKPSAAKALYEWLGATAVYDFSAGWGDRLIGALASKSVRLYVGTDPNTDNQSLYNSIQDTLDCKSTRVYMHTEPAEEFKPAKIYGQVFDLVFTSCPYFQLEMYASGSGDEDKQCWNRYKALEEWMEGFLQPAIQNAYDCLKPGGKLAINIADYQVGGGKNKTRIAMCDQMNDWIQTTLHCKYLGCVGMMLQKRYKKNTSEQRQAQQAFAEPIWLWKKV